MFPSARTLIVIRTATCPDRLPTKAAFCLMAVERLVLTAGSQGVGALWRSIPTSTGRLFRALGQPANPYGITVTPVSLIVNPLPLPAPVSTVQVIAVLVAWQRYW